MPRLASGTVSAHIAADGAWVEELRHNNEPIFHPRVSLRSEAGDEKIRGGMHVCLPNFGPGGESGLPQHGFGRTSDWDVIAEAEDSLTLRLMGQTVHYAQLESLLTYTLTDTSFHARLTLINHGARALRVAPAFHPYFALNDTETAIKVNGVSYELTELAGTEFIQTDTVHLMTVQQTFQLLQTGLPTWAIWTDQLGPYVCVEPTTGGYRFLEAESPDELITPSETRSYTFTIIWQR